MTELLERRLGTLPESDAVQTISVIRQAIDARLAEIHGEPAGRNDFICSALMLGSAAARQQIQV